MATSNCPKCPSTKFEIKEVTPKDANFKYQFVQCASCGCVVGVLDYYNTGAYLGKLEEKIDHIASRLK